MTKIPRQLCICFVVLFVSIQAYLPSEDNDGLTVSLDTGLVRGFRYSLSLGEKSSHGMAFLGIPFAKPPVGPRRFLYPEPVDPWTGILNATELPNSCYQAPDNFFGPEFYGSNMWNPNTTISEDCLYLNVWVPTHETTKPLNSSKLPVMVWIFGGGFYSGTSTLDVYNGEILAALNGVIVVSVAYRVGALGFLCLDDPNAPCNVGMFDQLLALDWVQRNARRFGGDQDNVTLFGESAGAASVSLHLLSRLSRDKFHRCILQSGSANMPWATMTLTEGKKRSKELGQLAVLHLKGCEDKGNDVRSVVQCLRGVDAGDLVEQQWVSRGILQFPFLPVVDGFFLTEEPSVSLRHRRFKKCPILLGSNRNEGSWFIVYELPENLSLDRKFMPREDFLISLKQLFFYYPQYRIQMDSSAVLDAIAFRYTDWTDPNNTDSNVEALDSSIGDSFFVCPLNEFARSYAAAGLPVYSYYFTHRYESNPWPDWMGVLHGDDVIFVFGHVLKPDRNYTESDQQLSRLMMRYWTNFARTGNPNHSPSDQSQLPEWPLYKHNVMEYLELNERLLQWTASSSSSSSSSSESSWQKRKDHAVNRGPRTEYCAFWNSYVPKLIVSTAAFKDKVEEWKLKFGEWSSDYLIEWKIHLDDFSGQDRWNQCPPRR